MPYLDVTALENNLERQIGWVRASESRLSLVLPLSTVLFGVIAAKLDQIPDGFTMVLGASWISLALVSLSIIFAAISTFPRTNGPSDSIVFFGSMARESYVAYLDKIENIDGESYRADLIRQIHRNSEIAANRYQWIKYSMVALLSSFPFWGYAASQLY